MVLHRETAELLIRANEIDFLRRPQLEKRLNEPALQEGVNGKHIRFSADCMKEDKLVNRMSISDISHV